MKIKIMFCSMVLLLSSFTENVFGDENTFYGTGAGLKTTGCCDTFIGVNAGENNTTGSFNTFVGVVAGNSNIKGNGNTFIGSIAGNSNSTGDSNTFLGGNAGYSNLTGSNNTFLGVNAGFQNTAGSGNVFLGYWAGYHEKGSNMLYIDNSDTTAPLIYGEFDNKFLEINGSLFAVRYDDKTAVTVWAPGSSNESSFKVVMPLSTGINNGKALAFTALNGPMEEPYARTMFYTDGSFGVGDGQGPRDTYLRRYSEKNFMIDSDKAGGSANLLVMGNIGIGTTDTSEFRLLVNGPAYATGGWQASDVRFKENLEPIESPLSKVLRMEGVAFNWRVKEYEGRGFPGGKHYGVVAQKVEEVLPEVVRERADGEKAVAYTEIIPVLIEAIKEQQKEIERLRFLVELRAKE